MWPTSNSICAHLKNRILLCEALGSGSVEIANWFRELQHYGFIEMTRQGCLGVEGKGKAPHWRLTEVGYMKDTPTQDFLKWNGVPFKKPATSKRKNRRRSAKVIKIA